MTRLASANGQQTQKDRQPPQTRRLKIRVVYSLQCREPIPCNKINSVLMQPIHASSDFTFTCRFNFKLLWWCFNITFRHKAYNINTRQKPPLIWKTYYAAVLIGRILGLARPSFSDGETKKCRPRKSTLPRAGLTGVLIFSLECHQRSSLRIEITDRAIMIA